MTEFKPGDHVKVEFEGVVIDACLNGLVSVRAGSVLYSAERIQSVHCTLIEPEIVLPEVPGTIVQVDPLNEHGELDTYQFLSSGWLSIRGSVLPASVLVRKCRRYGYRIITAAEAKGVSE